MGQGGLRQPAAFVRNARSAELVRCSLAQRLVDIVELGTGDEFFETFNLLLDLVRVDGCLVLLHGLDIRVDLSKFPVGLDQFRIYLAPVDAGQDGDQRATAMGYRSRAGGDLSLAAGRRAIVRDFQATGEDDDGECNANFLGCGDEGTFIWADSEVADFSSSGPDQFLVRASGGVAFGRLPVDYFEIQTPFDAVSGDGTDTRGAFRVRLNGFTRMRLAGNGGLAVGNSFNTSGVPERGLRVHGRTQIDDLSIVATNVICANADGVLGICASSQRFKQDVKALKTCSDLVDLLRPVTYRWIDSGDEDIGLVAEEVAKIDPRLVIYDVDGRIQGVKYRQLSAVLVQAMQEQASETQQLRHRLEKLEREQLSQLQ